MGKLVEFTGVSGQKVSRKINDEIRVSFIDTAIFVLFLIFIFLKLMQ